MEVGIVEAQCFHALIQEAGGSIVYQKRRSLLEHLLHLSSLLRCHFPSTLDSARIMSSNRPSVVEDYLQSLYWFLVTAAPHLDPADVFQLHLNLQGLINLYQLQCLLNRTSVLSGAARIAEAPRLVEEFFLSSGQQQQQRHVNAHLVFPAAPASSCRHLFG